MTTRKVTTGWSSALGAVIILSVVIMGCQSTYDPRTQTSKSTSPTGKTLSSTNRTGTATTGPTTTGPYGVLKADRVEDRMGRNSNPNLVIGHSDVVNKGSDVRNMEMMAKSVPGVEAVKVSLSGGNAYVSLDLMPNVTAQQARIIEEQVIRALYQKVPRYKFHMTSNDGVHR